jgi:tRNA wybutosine-synthesizing protein 2
MKFKAYLKVRLRDKVPDHIQLPNGYHLIGHVALLDIDKQLLPYVDLLGKIIIEYETRIKSVAIKIGPTTGVIRTPNYRLIAGNPITSTTHIENGVKFRVDPLRLTFSGGNKRERIQMPLKVEQDEVVVDMFSCVGQFALHIAKNSLASKVIAIEINPVAYKFLLENIILNNLKEKVNPILGDCRVVRPILKANRIIMGYLHDTIDYLSYALEMLTIDGGTIHMHMLIAKEEMSTILTKIENKCGNFKFVPKIIVRKVKKYAPNIGHFAFDIQLH